VEREKAEKDLQEKEKGEEDGLSAILPSRIKTSFTKQ